MAQHYKGDFLTSAKTLNTTDNLLHEAFTKSITQNIGATILNENLVDYEGTLYEYLLINAFNALNYYNAGNLEDALVEVRKISVKQKEYISKYGEVALSKQSLSQSDTNSLKNAVQSAHLNMNQINSIKPRDAIEDDIYRDSAFARYLSMILRMEYNDFDNAVIDARVVKTLRPSLDVQKHIDIPSSKGTINVLAFAGLINERYEQEIYFPENDYIYLGVISGVEVPPFNLKFVYPWIIPQPKSVDEIEIVFEDGRSQKLELLEDFDEAVTKDVNTKAGKAFSRSFFRGLTKKILACTAGATTISLAREASKDMDEIAGILTVATARIGAFAGVAAVDLSETADVRQCINLPSSVYCTSVELEPGLYSFKVLYKKNGKTIKEEQFKDIPVSAGKPKIVESLCVK